MARKLRDNLLLRLLLPMATILFVSGIFSYQLAVRFSNRSYDRALIEDARALSRVLRTQADGRLELPQGALEMLGPGQGEHGFTQIRSHERGVIVGDPDLPLPPEGDTTEALLYDGQVRGEAARLVALTIPLWPASDTGIVLVGEFRRHRESMAREIVAAVVVPQLILICLAVVIIVGGIASGLAPLRALAQMIRQRRRDELGLLPSTDVPAEAVPLIEAFNGLLGRLSETLTAQQRFVADAAHQLRTPLAVAKLQLEQILRDPSEDRRRQLLKQLEASVDRMARLSGQLLLLARAEPGAGPVTTEWVDLRSLALDMGGQWVPRALQFGRDLGFAGADYPVGVLGDRTLLGEMISNLLDNALRYGGPRITLRVSGGDNASGPELSVEDDGPGIPKEEQSHVFERFHRVPGTVGDGSGLGLAIVREIALGHGADIGLESPASGGLRVRVKFPPFVAR